MHWIYGKSERGVENHFDDSKRKKHGKRIVAE